MRVKILIAFLVVFSSCDTERYIYSPSPANNPYFKEKGDSKLAGYYSGGGNDSKAGGSRNEGFDVQAAYAISNHWAVTASLFKRWERDIYPAPEYNYFDSSIVSYKRSITDFGGGYFVALGKKQIAFFSIYGGLGFGKFSIADRGLDNNRLSYARSHTSDITKWFIQPSLNVFASDYFRASFIAKFSFVHYGRISTNYTNEELQYYWLDRINGKTFQFFEPTFNIQFGIPPVDWVKVDGGFTFSPDPYDDVSRIRARRFNGSIGLCFDLSKLKRK